MFSRASVLPVDVQAVFQRACTEALGQLALFDPGKDALLHDEAAINALEAVVECGMTAEAKEHAQGALIALRGVAKHGDIATVAKHIMLSYCWRHQNTIVRINESLKRRLYTTWMDTEQSK